MGVFVSNKNLKCNSCGYPTVKGKMSISTDNRGKEYTECRWSCPRCLRLIRLDRKEK